MPTLNWIGKEKIVTHHLDVPYHVLNRVRSYDKKGEHKKDNKSKNMIIHGDNLQVLKSLLPKYEGRIDCVYIDPPYNTGNEQWIYDDNVKDPKILKWLGKVVGAESEDLCRHDKWLCMMYPRLCLLHKLLADDGFIFISINFKDELHHLRMICDEIFGSKNYIGTLTWESVTQPVNAGAAKFNLQQKVEAILLYIKRKEEFKGFKIESVISNKNYPEQGTNGPFRTEIIEKSDAGGYNRETMKFPILGQLPREGKRWQIGEKTARELEAKGRLGIFDGVVKKIIYPEDEQDSEQTIPFWSHYSAEEYGTAMSGKKAVNQILGKPTGFDTVKPVELLKALISRVPSKKAIFLDCFAGTGTLAQAVLEKNMEDQGERSFICVEKEDYCTSILEERIKRIISSYETEKEQKQNLYEKKLTLATLKDGKNIIEEAKKVKELNAGTFDKIEGPKIENDKLVVKGITKKSSHVPGTGGDFSYYEVGDPIFVGDYLNEKLDDEIIDQYIWFTETHSDYKQGSKDKNGLLGIHNFVAYYFLYKKDKTTKLALSTLRTLTKKAKSYVIYADVCTLSEQELMKYNITFKKIPRGIVRF